MIEMISKRPQWILALCIVLLPLSSPDPAAAQGPAASPVSALPNPPHLPPSIVQALQQAQLPADALALAVLPLEPVGPAALMHQAHKAMQPASAMKVVTSAVALDRLGPNRRGYTELRTAAPVQSERLRGDLVLRGGSDPELGLPQLWALLLELRESGVRHLDGDIVLDRTLFHPAREDIGVPPFDEAPEFPYNVIPDALQFSGNLHALEVVSDERGIQARLVPELPGVKLVNALRLHEKPDVPCAQWSSQGWRTPLFREDVDGSVSVVLHGTFPQACRARANLQLMERNLQAQAQLRWLWQSLGGSWTGRVREARVGEFNEQDPGFRLLARREARPWGEWLRPVNKVSDNVATRLLYLLTGVEEAQREASAQGRSGVSLPSDGASGRPPRTTREWADRSVRRWFVEHGIPTEGLVMDNGSGLSRSERITPMQLALVLRMAHTRLHAPDLLMSLPIAGVDGSLRNRMTDGPAKARARLKPGTLRNVVALAGYVQDARGRMWVMAAMINHEDARRGRPVLDALAHWVAQGP